MISLIKIVNTIFFIIILSNPVVHNTLLNNLRKIYNFLLYEINRSFQKQDEFIEYLVLSIFQGGKANTETNNLIVDTEEKDNSEDVNKNEDKTKEEKKEEKFEDKYLQRFKKFKNEYTFTETELELQQHKYEELKKQFETDKAKAIDNLSWTITKIQRICDCAVVDENRVMIDINEKGIKLLIKFFNIEEKYEDDPELYNLNDLYIELSEILAETQEKLNKEHDNNVKDEEFKTQAYQYMLDKKLDGYMNNYVNEMTPLGNVYMRYNNSKKSFEYYSNNTIPYRFLEPVGRKFVLTYFCKPLFIDIEYELNKAKLKKEEQDTLNSNKPEIATDKKNVFAKLKSYNSVSNNSNELSRIDKKNVLPAHIKANLPNVNSTNTSEEMLLKENANRYTWEGRLSNMSLLKKIDRKTIDKKYAMTFADFKRLNMR
jgi:hypothetical protein